MMEVPVFQQRDDVTLFDCFGEGCIGIVPYNNNLDESRGIQMMDDAYVLILKKEDQQPYGILISQDEAVRTIVLARKTLLFEEPRFHDLKIAYEEEYKTAVAHALHLLLTREFDVLIKNSATLITGCISSDTVSSVCYFFTHSPGNGFELEFSNRILGFLPLSLTAEQKHVIYPKLARLKEQNVVFRNHEQKKLISVK